MKLFALGEDGGNPNEVIQVRDRQAARAEALAPTARWCVSPNVHRQRRLHAERGKGRSPATPTASVFGRSGSQSDDPRPVQPGDVALDREGTPLTPPLGRDESLRVKLSHERLGRALAASNPLEARIWKPDLLVAPIEAEIAGSARVHVPRRHARARSRAVIASSLPQSYRCWHNPIHLPPWAAIGVKPAKAQRRECAISGNSAI